MDSEERARNQSINEWLAEYETGKPVEPVSQVSITRNNAESTQVLLRYDGHRTTKRGRLVVVFTVISTGEEAVAFFNVNLVRSRGENKGTYYPTGSGGQFNSHPRSNFRKWWMQMVGQRPRRWARVHIEMKPRLQGIVFTANLQRAYRGDGTSYLLAKNIRKYEHN